MNLHMKKRSEQVIFFLAQVYFTLPTFLGAPSLLAFSGRELIICRPSSLHRLQGPRNYTYQDLHPEPSSSASWTSGHPTTGWSDASSRMWRDVTFVTGWIVGAFFCACRIDVWYIYIYYHTLRIHICSKISGFPRTKSEKTCGWDETRPSIHPKFSGGVWSLFFSIYLPTQMLGIFLAKNRSGKYTMDPIPQVNFVILITRHAQFCIFTSAYAPNGTGIFTYIKRFR